MLGLWWCRNLYLSHVSTSRPGTSLRYHVPSSTHPTPVLDNTAQQSQSREQRAPVPKPWAGSLAHITQACGPLESGPTVFSVRFLSTSITLQVHRGPFLQQISRPWLMLLILLFSDTNLSLSKITQGQSGRVGTYTLVCIHSPVKRARE